MKFGYKLVIVVRKDLDLSPGKLAVQVSHASVSCALESKKKNKDYFKKWINEGQKKVLVKCENLDKMKSLKGEADGRGLATKLVSDAGLTEVKSGTRTCLGVGPGPNDLVDEVTGNLSLY